MNRLILSSVSTIMIVFGALALATSPVKAKEAGCCYHHCMATCLGTGELWLTCHTQCNADCEACPQ